jgi:hypothetical protein
MQDDPKFKMNLKKRFQGLAWQKALRENFNEPPGAGENE